MTTLAVTRHPVFAWLASMLMVLLIRHETALLLRIDRTIEMACARVAPGAAAVVEFNHVLVASNTIAIASLGIKGFMLRTL